MTEPSLAGLYITDGRIFGIVGSDEIASIPKREISELSLSIPTSDPTKKPTVFLFSKKKPIEETFDAACAWIAKAAPNVRSIGVGCYGPFRNINPEDRDKASSDYGYLQATSHGELSNRNLVGIVQKGLAKHLTHSPRISINMDVALDAMGLIYNKSRNKALWESAQENTIALLRIDRGIGGSFMRMRDAYSWLGALHPEVGQINVQRWEPTSGTVSRQEAKREASGHVSGVMNKNSVEGLASIPAIERWFDESFATLKSNPSHIAWEREAWYLAQLSWAITCVVSPSKIYLCGEIMTVNGLHEKIVQAFSKIKETPSFPSYAALEDVDTYLESLTTVDTKGQLRSLKPGVTGSLCAAALAVQGIAQVKSMKTITG